MIARILIDNNTRSALTPEWGLSVWIEHSGHRFLLDTGASARFAENAVQMGLDLEEAEFAVLSHAHYDHSDGMEAFFEKNRTAPMYLRKGSGENCYSRQEKVYRYIGIKEGYLEKFKDRLVYVEGDFEACPGVTLIPHKTRDLETLGRKAGMYIKRGSSWLPDSFFHEQSLAVDTERGIMVFNSCSHGGADNIIRETAETWPDRHIYGIVGGLHLFRSSDEEVRALAGRIRETGIEAVYTGHCTGERQFEILTEELGDVVCPLYTGLEIVV